MVSKGLYDLFPLHGQTVKLYKFSLSFMQEKTEHGIKELRQSTGFGAIKNEHLNCRSNFQSNLAKEVLTSIFSV